MSSGPEVCRGKKRPIEEPSNSFESDGDETNLIQLKKKCLELERRVQELEGMWMRKYTSCNISHIINFFI
jgi:hypothetical protein